jgi:hypothetical protein
MLLLSLLLLLLLLCLLVVLVAEKMKQETMFCLPKPDGFFYGSEFCYFLMSSQPEGLRFQRCRHFKGQKKGRGTLSCFADVVPTKFGISMVCQK